MTAKSEGDRNLSTPTDPDLTQWLRAAARGDREAMDRCLPMLYDELRRVARREMRRELPGRTLHPTGLVHEVYTKLAGRLDARIESRAHFLAVAARAMREILVDAARRRRARKRGGDRQRTTLETGIADEGGAGLGPVELLDLDRALESLEERAPRQRRVVELRFFGGLTEDEVARVLCVTARTVRRDWVTARAWLYRELHATPEARATES